jgi:predicted nucleic acid-binding protein
MPELDDPVLFDVGVVALAHSRTPMCGTALEYVRNAIHGDLDAVVPYQALFGAHHILNRDYGLSRSEATHILENFLSARQVHWYAGPNGADTQQGLDLAGEHNIEGWDGYYAHVAQTTGATTVVTLDDDFERVENLSVEIPLNENEREQLHEYLMPDSAN